MAYLKKISLVLSTLVLCVLFIAPVSVSAEAVSVSLSSSAGTVQGGSSFVVTATINTTGSVSDALVRINFDNSKLVYVSADYSNSPLAEDFGSQAGANYYISDRYKSLAATPPSGSFTLVRLTFRATASSGSTAINISTVDSSVGNSINSQPHSPLSASGVSINLTAPPAPSQAPLAGTSVPATPSQPSRYTPPVNPAPEANNADVTPIETTESTETPEPSPASLADTPKSIVAENATMQTEEKGSVALIIVAVISGLLVIGAGVLLARNIMSKRAISKYDVVKQADNSLISEENSHLNDSLSGVKTPDTPEAGSVVSPQDDYKS